MSTVIPRPSSGDRSSVLLIGALLGLLVAVVVAPGLLPARAADDAQPPEHSISVTGVGRILIRPDVADLTLGITVERTRAREAGVDAAEYMTAVVAALRAAGVAETDIQTSMVSLQPVYDWNSTPQRITGYTSDNIVRVTVRDLSTAGAVIDAAVDAGATNVSGISFRVDDQTAAERQARTAAMVDARAKADALAGAGDVRITGVITISEVSSPWPGPIPYPVAEDDGRATTPIQPGNVELNVTVTVVYSIG